MRLSKLRLVALLALACSGCSTLPVGGPNHFVIDREASEAILQERRTVVQDYVLLDINRPVLDYVVDVGPESFFRTFGTGRGPSPEIKVGVGDVLSVSIFESSAGGLFMPGEVGSRPGNFITLPSQTVDFRGNITVPFAGEVRAAGSSIPKIQREVVSKLSSRAIEPQVVIALQEQNATEVAVFGDATGNFKAKIRPGGERVLDVVAKAGLRFPGYETFVTLQRANKRATVYFPTLINKPNENIFVRPGDILYLYREQQKYVAVGALGNTSQTQGLTGQFIFDSEKLSLVEAVAKAGGLLDTRAAASQVFLYRLEYRETLEALGMNLGRFAPSQRLIPTIYRANYRDPSVFFFAQEFQMRNRDIIYVANADVIELDKFLGLIRLISGTTAGVASDVVTIGDPSGAVIGN